MVEETAKQSKVQSEGEQQESKKKNSADDSSGSNKDSYDSPKASEVTMLTKGTEKNDEAFETRIFGKRAMTLKKKTKSLERKKE